MDYITSMTYKIKLEKHVNLKYKIYQIKDNVEEALSYTIEDLLTLSLNRNTRITNQFYKIPMHTRQVFTVRALNEIIQSSIINGTHKFMIENERVREGGGERDKAYP
jgi:hypothetical protein